MPTEQAQTKAKHTAAAIRIAEILTGGKYGSRKRYVTMWGRKTVMGIADLIDNVAHLPELLRLVTECQELLNKFEDEHIQDHGDGFCDSGLEPDPKKCLDCAWIDEVQGLITLINKGA